MNHVRSRELNLLDNRLFKMMHIRQRTLTKTRQGHACFPKEREPGTFSIWTMTTNVLTLPPINAVTHFPFCTLYSFTSFFAWNSGLSCLPPYERSFNYRCPAWGTNIPCFAHLQQIQGYVEIGSAFSDPQGSETGVREEHHCAGELFRGTLDLFPYSCWQLSVDKEAQENILVWFLKEVDH